MLKKALLVGIGISILLLTGCKDNKNPDIINPITNTPTVIESQQSTGNPINVSTSSVDKITEILQPTRYYSTEGKKYADAEWLQSQWFWDVEYTNDFSPYMSKGLLIPIGKVDEDTICIADLVTKTATYILYEGDFTISDFMDKLVIGDITDVHKETVEDGYGICLHTKEKNDTEHSYMFRYYVEDKEVWFMSITDLDKQRIYQLGYSSQLDLDNIDLSDEIVDAGLELCSCGCDDVLGTCTEDEECNDDETGCIDDGYYIVD